MKYLEVVMKQMDEKGVAVKTLATETGYSAQYISYLLNGKRRWNEETMNKVNDFLNLEVTISSKKEDASCKN